jgi:hypothetical protein
MTFPDRAAGVGFGATAMLIVSTPLFPVTLIQGTLVLGVSAPQLEVTLSAADPPESSKV